MPAFNFWCSRASVASLIVFVLYPCSQFSYVALDIVRQQDIPACTLTEVSNVILVVYATLNCILFASDWVGVCDIFFPVLSTSWFGE